MVAGSPASSKLDRVRAALRGEAPDRPPYSFWTHLPGIDLDPQRLAHESAAFCRRYDLDFLKSMPNGLYCVEDWGCVCDYSGIERGGVAVVVEPAVRHEEDWSALERVDVTRGSFGRELEHLRLLVDLVGPDVAVLATIFSPLTIAGKLSNGASRAHLARDPAHVQRGLETITEVTCAFTRSALEAGCAGIFFALQEATRSAFDEENYRRHGEPYDRRVLAEAASHGGWFNTVHMHGDEILFDVVKDYDVTALNWHIGETPPAIAEYRRSGGVKPVLGGLQRAHLTRRDQAGIAADLERAMEETRGRGILISPACVIRHPVDEATLDWTAQRIRSLGDA
jgi:uroporphyrinogen decarboxylase